MIYMPVASFLPNGMRVKHEQNQTFTRVQQQFSSIRTKAELNFLDMRLYWGGGQRAVGPEKHLVAAQDVYFKVLYLFFWDIAESSPTQTLHLTQRPSEHFIPSSGIYTKLWCVKTIIHYCLQTVCLRFAVSWLFDNEKLCCNRWWCNDLWVIATPA